MTDTSVQSPAIVLPRVFVSSHSDDNGISELDAMSARIPACADAELFKATVAGIRTSEDLQADMESIKRWHGYYKAPPYRDANGLGHISNTAGIAEVLTDRDVRAGIISREDQGSLLTTVLVHDLGEVNLGNATYGGKSEAHEKKEIEIFRKNLPIFFPQLDPKQLARLEQLYIDVAMGKDFTQPLPRYFNMIEVTGYTTFGMEMFESRPRGFAWEVLAWRILAYHLFRPGKDVPVHVQWSDGAHDYWRDRLDRLDAMVDHFRPIDQQKFLLTTYRRTCLPDCATVKPLDLGRWTDIRELIGNPRQ